MPPRMRIHVAPYDGPGPGSDESQQYIHNNSVLTLFALLRFIIAVSFVNVLVARRSIKPFYDRGARKTEYTERYNVFLHNTRMRPRPCRFISKHRDTNTDTIRPKTRMISEKLESQVSEALSASLVTLPSPRHPVPLRPSPLAPRYMCTLKCGLLLNRC